MSREMSISWAAVTTYNLAVQLSVHAVAVLFLLFTCFILSE